MEQWSISSCSKTSGGKYFTSVSLLLISGWDHHHHSALCVLTELVIRPYHFSPSDKQIYSSKWVQSQESAVALGKKEY